MITHSDSTRRSFVATWVPFSPLGNFHIPTRSYYSQELERASPLVSFMGSHWAQLGCFESLSGIVGRDSTDMDPRGRPSEGTRFGLTADHTVDPGKGGVGLLQGRAKEDDDEDISASHIRWFSLVLIRSPAISLSSLLSPPPWNRRQRPSPPVVGAREEGQSEITMLLLRRAISSSNYSSWASCAVRASGVVVPSRCSSSSSSSSSSGVVDGKLGIHVFRCPVRACSPVFGRCSMICAFFDLNGEEFPAFSCLALLAPKHDRMYFFPSRAALL